MKECLVALDAGFGTPKGKADRRFRWKHECTEQKHRQRPPEQQCELRVVLAPAVAASNLANSK
jgi:hypothetical protein